MCKHCEWEDLLEEISEMLGDDDYEFAVDTLEGIQTWVDQNEHCTDGQKDAIENIRESVENR